MQRMLFRALGPIKVFIQWTIVLEDEHRRHFPPRSLERLLVASGREWRRSGNCWTLVAILALSRERFLLVYWSVWSPNGGSFLTTRTLRNLDWWNLVRGLIGLKDRSKRSLYWLDCLYTAVQIFNKALL